MREKASKDMIEELSNSGYLEKIKELNDKVDMVIAGDCVLEKVTSMKFKSKYIDVYVSIPPPYNQCPMNKFICALFKLDDNEDEDYEASDFVSYKEKTKFGQTTFYISLKSQPHSTKTLCIHFVRGTDIAEYIQSKFDLTTSMIWFDLHEIHTNRFWQQVCGVQFINNDYYLEETGDRLDRFLRLGFHNIDDFDWQVYLYQQQCDMDYDPYSD